jgi:endo-1,4-beta-xylanase
MSKSFRWAWVRACERFPIYLKGDATAGRGRLGAALVMFAALGCGGEEPTTDPGASGASSVAGSAGSSSAGSSSAGSSFGGNASAGSNTGGGPIGGAGSSSGGAGGSSGGLAGASPGGAGGGMGGTAQGGSGTSGAPGTGGQIGKFVGNITTGNSIDPSGRKFSTYWNQITPENAGKWGSVQRSATAAFNWTTLDSIYDYAQKNNVIFKQHVFVWGSQQPTGTLTEADVKKWMTEFCKRYPKTALIDVVNEPPPHTTPSYANAIGGGTNTDWKWIVNAFTWARAACPSSVLILNDYNNIEYADQNKHFIDIAKAVKAAGAPIDALGAQAHGLAGNVSTDTMKSLLTKMHTDTGLPVYITEYDIGLADDAKQLAKYQEHMGFFLGTAWIPGVTIWGWIDGQTWVANTGLIKNGKPRSAMTWLMQELKRPAP